VVTYQTWPGYPERVGIVAFSVNGRDHAEVATILSAEYGIGVRNGSFCAHPLLAHLADGGPDEWRPGCGRRVPGAIRASLGLGNVDEDVDRLAEALLEIATRGPRWKYRKLADGGVVPEPDDRRLPAFLSPAAPASEHGEEAELLVGAAAGAL
jgi:hypothetical protein